MRVDRVSQGEERIFEAYGPLIRDFRTSEDNVLLFIANTFRSPRHVYLGQLMRQAPRWLVVFKVEGDRDDSQGPGFGAHSAI